MTAHRILLLSKMIKTLIMEGASITGIYSFYAEINRVFMTNEEWKIGQSLDAFNDLLYGGFGEVPAGAPLRLIWRNIEVAERSLGKDATSEFYFAKLNNPTVYNAAFAKEKLDELERGEGQTFYQIVREIIADHPAIELVEGRD